MKGISVIAHGRELQRCQQVRVVAPDGRVNYVCGVTGNAHAVLAGFGVNGFLTRAAQVYPYPLAVDLLQQLLDQTIA